MSRANQRPVQELSGVRLGALVKHGDARGSFAELWRAQSVPGTEGLPAVQANLSESAVGVLRGLHLHRRQLDLWIVLRGKAHVVLVDVRPCVDDPSAAPIVGVTVMEPGATLLIPDGVAHGFLALEPLQLLYFVTNAYDGSDELGFSWNDPALGIEWPEVPTEDGQPVLSDRDMANPPLARLVANLRA